MSTSLAEQLQRLAVPQTSVFKRDKKRASLLFDPKEAANLTKETVYQIGVDGLEELKNRNPVFQQFENTLFHITSKDFERSVESAESNQRLNKNIRKFLLLLSPHFLLNCSYKALEWLVHRYYIHEYNKEDLLMLILPYHETNIFVRALQLLNLREPNDKWGWLKPLQKPGIHLPKQTLYNHAASDVYFLEFVSNFVLTTIKEHEKPACLTVVFNFYWTTFTGALEYSQEINEAQVTQMLPVLLKGLTSEIPDFAAASYIITAKLVTKTQLSDKILEKFLEKVTQLKVTSLLTEAMLVLVVLYQSQTQYPSISELALNNICKREGFAKTLEQLNTDGIHIYSFLKPLLWNAILCALTKENGDIYMNFVDSILADVKIDEEFVEALFVSVLDIYNGKDQYPEKTFQWLKEFIKKIEKQHPMSFDFIVKNVMTTTNDPVQIQHQKALRKLVHNFTDIQDSFELFEKLYHPNSKIRIEGLKMLHKKCKILVQKEGEMLQNAFFDRLNDDSLEVVRETLVLFKEEFPKVVNMNDLKKVLINLLNKCQNDKRNWWEICSAVLDVFCFHYDDSDVKVFIAILPFLLPSFDDELDAAKQIIFSEYGKKSKILGPLKVKLRGLAKFKFFSNVVFKKLQEDKNLPDVRLVVDALKEMHEQNDVLQRYLGLLLLGLCLPDGCSPETCNLVLDVFEIYLNTSKLTMVKGEATVFDFIMLAKGHKFTIQGFLYCLKNLILKTKVPERIHTIDFVYEKSSLFYLRLLQILIKGYCSHKEVKSEIYLDYLRVYTHLCEDNILTMIELLLNISIINDDEIVTDEFRLGCVKSVRNLLSKAKIPAQEIIDINKTIVPYILVGLHMSNEKQRKILMEIVTENILNELDADGKKIPYGKLLMKLSKYQLEILLDHEQIPLVTFNVLSQKRDENELKQVLDVLLQTACNNRYPIYLRSGLTSLLAHVNSLDVYTDTSKLALNILHKDRELNGAELEIIHKNILRFNSSTANLLEENSVIYQFLKSCLSHNIIIKSKIEILNQIDRELFSQLNRNIQMSILDSIIELATNNQNPDVLQAAAHVFKRIDLDATLILPQLQQMRDVKSPKQDETKRKKRIGIIPTVDILDTNEWRKGVTVLEFIQDKKKIRKTAALLRVLFEVLKKCLDFDEQASVEYPKQLILSTILHSCNKIEGEPLPENAFNMQLVVQCVRASQNPQTHHHALLLLAHTASLIPKQVLHHIIAIFTFVGSSVLRHDDAYSFQIITKIIETIIPILIEDGRMESVEKVLRVFVDAILDIPEHRRMPLFKQLLTHLDPKENLYLFFLIIFEAHVVHGHMEKQKINKNRSLVNLDEVPKRLDIAADLAREFSPEIVIVSCIKVLEYLRKLPEEKNDATSKFVFDIKRYTAKQFRHYKYVIITFTANLLSSTQFVNQVAKLSDDEILGLESLFKDMIINILNYIQVTSKVAERNSNTPQAQYWKVILHHSYDVLDAINALLTNQLFLMVIRGLMVYSLSTVRKRALELLNNKLQHNSEFINECDKTELYNTIVSPLVNIIKSINTNDEPEQELIIQKALFSLKLLVKHLAQENPDKFTQILDFISDLIKANVNKINENTLASLILCLAELCNTLKARAISTLNKFMPILIKILKSHKNLDTPNLLLISDITAIQKIVDSLPLFISPYLEKLLYEVALLSCKWNMESEDPKIAPFTLKLKGILQKLGLVIPLRVLLPSIENSYNSVIAKKKFAAIAPLMMILLENLSNLKGSEIQGYLNELTSFFMCALQFRADGHCTHEQANEVEEHINKAMVKLVLKLSESTFRPLYFKLYDWAVRSNAKTERIITFYNVSVSFANSLKGLFVLFAGHFLNNAATLLDNCNQIKQDELYFDDDNDKNIALLENILKTLSAIFLYDSQKFVTKERFDVLMQPVVDQLENTLGGIENLEKRAKDVLIPCIAQFAVATADDALWKQMNYQILLKTRHNSPNIRLIALECLSETAKKLGEDFLPLLPETIPFLAELLEDEDENVEKSCQKAVQELEKVLGEPLQKYF
ncbi:hypothetical protein ILUMI_24517 [Ignelater luminosus]|uniref:HEAT repeat-containing protein 1 n=1 Tax=Ignelater luminosus TaxID=2038154 RepID=A0A8K0C641_IGNLU|nr:hypothetical protein ILUMI_24517 [Ignelater luminosus]